MSLIRIVSATAVALVGVALATVAFAGAADDAIKGRQACMKAHGQSMKVMVPMSEGKAPFDKAAVDKILAAEDAACADWDKWWGADTQKGETVETYAKPEIWTDAKGFEAAGGVWYEANKAVKASADQAAFNTTFPKLADSCKGCHEKFRRPKQ